jgi:hypothetical protein
VAAGVAEFKNKYLGYYHIIERDAGLPRLVRGRFWTCLDSWPSTGTIEAWFDRCCEAHQFEGPEARLDRGEQVGTAQKKRYFKNNFAAQTAPGLPAYTPVQAEMYMNKVLREANEITALRLFKQYFGGLRLRPLAGKKARIFAFRDLARPTDPLGTNLPDLFARLAIPNATADEYVMLAFRPGAGDKVREPNCLDAQFANLEKFVPGGRTAGGVLEIIVTPPRCSDVTRAPKHIR